MIVLIIILTILVQGLVMGCFGYCGVRIYRLPHMPWRWRLYISMPFFAVVAYLFIVLATAPFAARPTYVVWWTAIVRLLGLLALAGGISFTTLFFFGWINGVGSHAKPEAKNDAE